MSTKLIEMSQVALSTPFDNTGSDIISNNVQDAIVETQFPLDYIAATYTVPLHRQYIVSQQVTIALTGRLIIYGRARIL